VLQLWARNLILMIIFSQGLHLWLYGWKKQEDDYKFDRRGLAKNARIFLWNDQYWDNVTYTLLSGVTFWTFYDVIVWMGYANGWARMITVESNPIWFFVLFLLMPVFQSFHFYWLHRALHTPWIYQRKATPQVEALSDTSFRVDARHGFAHPAIEAGFKHLIPAAKAHGVAAMGVYNSYNAATLGFHTGYLARAGLLALGATNAVPNLAPVGGKTPIIGTNPDFLCGSRPGWRDRLSGRSIGNAGRLDGGETRRRSR
jgi:hypothetical protein